MGLIYLDSCICIYAIEQSSHFHVDVLAAMASVPAARFAISPLVMAECLVRPLKAGNVYVEQDYEALFRRVTILDMPAAVYRQAAQIRSAGKLKMPDALHLACAQYHACEALWTNDDRLGQASSGLAQAIVSDVGNVLSSPVGKE